MCIYGYARISSNRQNIERQVRNILKEYPDAIVIQEVFTGTKFQERKKLQKLIATVKSGDVIVFDSVSRMSRNAEDGIKLYEELMDKGVELVFLKEAYINTATYKNSIKDKIEMTGTDEDILFNAINEYMRRLARKQIVIAFEQAEKEVMDLRQRTREGLVTAQLNGKQIGQVKGTKLITKKSVEAKEGIKKYSKDFGGTLSDPEVIKLLGISRPSYYKYKRELRDGI